MQDSDNDHLIVTLKVENTVILAHEIPVFRMNRNQRIQWATPSGKGFKRLNALFLDWR